MGFHVVRHEEVGRELIRMVAKKAVRTIGYSLAVLLALAVVDVAVYSILKYAEVGGVVSRWWYLTLAGVGIVVAVVIEVVVVAWIIRWAWGNRDE